MTTKQSKLQKQQRSLLKILKQALKKKQERDIRAEEKWFYNQLITCIEEKKYGLYGEDRWEGSWSEPPSYFDENYWFKPPGWDSYSADAQHECRMLMGFHQFQFLGEPPSWLGIDYDATMKGDGTLIFKWYDNYDVYNSQRMLYHVEIAANKKLPETPYEDNGVVVTLAVQRDNARCESIAREGLNLLRSMTDVFSNSEIRSMRITRKIDKAGRFWFKIIGDHSLFPMNLSEVIDLLDTRSLEDKEQRKEIENSRVDWGF